MVTEVTCYHGYKVQNTTLLGLLYHVYVSMVTWGTVHYSYLMLGITVDCVATLARLTVLLLATFWCLGVVLSVYLTSEPAKTLIECLSCIKVVRNVCIITSHQS